jgi:MFS family permease
MEILKKMPGSRRIAVLMIVCLSSLAMPLSFTGPAVALPAIAAELGGSPAALNWLTNAFMLSFGSMLMAAGTLADSFGRKRVFMIGVAGFVLTSAAMGFASDLMWLDALRFAQGAASAMALSGGAAALAQEFEGRASMQAFSVLGSSFGAGLAFGPVFAGFLIEHFSWRAIFLGVALSSGLALFGGAFCLRETRDPEARGLDWFGMLTFTGALACFTFAMLEAPGSGWVSGKVLALLSGAVILLLVFVVGQRKAAKPMLDLSLFRYPRFVGVQFLAMAPAYCYVVLLVLLPARLIGIEGAGAQQAGKLMIALSAPVMVLPLACSTLMRWLSAASMAGGGLLLAACGLIWLAQWAPHSPFADAAIPMFMIGVGVSLPWGLMDGMAVSVVPKEKAGMAAGIFNTTRVAGEGIALAVVAALLAVMVQRQLSHAVGTMENSTLALAAQRLSMGDMRQATASLPETGQVILLQAYAAAFQTLLYVLAAVTVACACLIWRFLSGRDPAADFERGASTGQLPA